MDMNSYDEEWACQLRWRWNESNKINYRLKN